MPQTIVGIDFSLNSPGICIKEEDYYTFASFFNFEGRSFEDKRIPKRFNNHLELQNIEGAITVPYSRVVKSKDYIEKERQKIEDAQSIASHITSFIWNWTGSSEIKICIEGFSYGSKGNSFIDMVGYNWLLRSEIVKIFGSDSLHIYTPSLVKKTAGKGNANKEFMFESFKSNVLEDELLADNNFFKYTCSKEKLGKPLDDLIDSYFIVKTHELSS